MKKLLLLIKFIILISSNYCFSQFSFTSSVQEHTENFTIGTSATASLPTGYKFGADWSSGTTSTITAAGTVGTGILTSSSNGSAYNFANGVTASSTERAIGFLNSGGFSSPRSIIFAFTNNTGVTITNLSLSWDYEKYRSGTRAWDWTFFHGNTSTATIAATAGDQSYSSDANNTTVSNPPLSAKKTFNLTGLSIANGATYYLRWTLTGNGGSSNGQALGIDNVFVFANCLDPLLSTSNKTGLVEKCSDANYTNYGDATGTYFSIKKNGNTINATVDLTVNGGAQAPYVNTSTSGANKEHASYLIGRYWNVTCTGCSYSSGGGVDVRFFYNPAEITNARTDRNTAWATLKTTNTSTLADTSATIQWFKTNSTAFAPSDFTGNILSAAHTKLTGTLGTLNSVNYVEFTGVTSFSGGTGGFAFGQPAGSGTSLPVTWVSVIGTPNEIGNEIIWKTATETNTSHFEVETSIDGKNFSKIGDDILATGNSNSILTYSVIDKTLAPEKYYRIKQVDLDDRFEYSKTIVIKRSESLAASFKVQAFPIPLDANRMLKIAIQKLNHSDVQLILKDISGKPVLKKTISGGYHIEQELNMNIMEGGIYFLEIKNETSTKTLRIVL